MVLLKNGKTLSSYKGYQRDFNDIWWHLGQGRYIDVI